MTVQASETIIYKGINYPLSTYPLYSYIQKFGEIEFEMVNTALWRGYLGSWEIKDGKLFLNDIHSSNKTKKDIFQTEEPVFAEWYSGNLKIGLGDTIHTEYAVLNEKYLICEIVEGYVIKEFFVEPAYEKDVVIGFGKHKGRKIEDVIKGELHFFAWRKIKEYLEDIIQFYVSPHPCQSILIPDFRNLETEKKKLTREMLSKKPIDFLVSENFIALNQSDSIIGENYQVYYPSKLFSEFLEKLLTLTFTNLIILKRATNELEGISKTSLAIQPDYSYIIWAIKSVEKFYVPPYIIEQEFEIKQIDKFSVKRIHDHIIEYEPLFSTKKFQFPEAIKLINLKKFQTLTNKKYDKENNWYLLGLRELSHAERMYSQPQRDKYRWSEDELRYADWDYNPHNPAHDASENIWIDVLGAGEDSETAYWNTD